MRVPEGWSRFGVVAIAALAFAAGSLRGGGAVPSAQAQESAKAVTIDAARYPTLQAALDAVPTAGGVVRIPPGQYELTRPLVLTRENTRIEGSGAATHLVNKSEDGQPALVIRPATRAENARARIWRVQLADFRVSGNPKSGDGILAEAANELLIHNVAVDHNGGHGINLVDCLEDPRVSDSILTYNGQAGLNILRNHDIVVNANQFEENQDAVRCIDSFNLCMNGNNVDDHLRHGIVIENTYGSVLSGNMIEECKGTAIILDRDCYGDTISANVIAHNAAGIDLRDAWGCAISANTFPLVASRAVAVGSQSGRITITGNNFCNSYVGGKTVIQDPATGIVLQNTADVVVTGNSFSGLSRHAVVTEGECRRVLVDGNVMTDLSWKAPERVPAAALGSARESTLGTNIVEKGFSVTSPGK